MARSRVSLSHSQYRVLFDYYKTNLATLQLLSARAASELASKAMGFPVSDSTIEDLRKDGGWSAPRPATIPPMALVNKRITELEARIAALETPNNGQVFP